MKTLYAFSNQLSELPPEIGQFQKLQRFNVSFNQLRELPPEIGQLQNLQQCYAQSSQLSTLPPEIGQLQNLQIINVSSNQLSTLPPKIGQLQNLQKFYASSNQLSTLPTEIGQLQNLQHFDVRSNQLSEMPPGITQIKLNWEWEDNSFDKGIYFFDNPLKPPIEIIIQGQKAVREYFARLEEEKEMLYEGKVLFVGQGGVGKTSLMKRLIFDKYEERENTTEGIDIHQWKLKALDGKEMTLNTWDFGGQEIYHATHQFFLTQRSMYVLVWDARQEEEYGRIDYWLNTIQTFADNSPILIVMNKNDERNKDLNLGDIRESFPQVVDAIKTSAKKSLGIPHLREILGEETRRLPLMGTPWPKTWLDIRTTLEEDPRQQMPFTEFLTLCQSKNIEPDKANILSQYLHDLGIILHFREDLLLKDTLILKPGWGTEAVYKMLDAKQVQKRNGTLFNEDLPLVWPDQNRYPPDKYATLLRLMANFELAFPLEDGKGHIIPEMLASTPEQYSWNQDNPLRFEYHYEFLPAGVFTRFIVRMHGSLIEKDKRKLCWKEGAYLYFEQSQAQVRIFPLQKKTVLEISGKNRREFLAIIRSHFQVIHESIKKIQVKEKIPCTCVPGCKYRFEYEYLLKCFRKGKIEVDCHETAEDVSLKSLLEGIEGPSNEGPLVFISYAREDAPSARRLFSDLLQQNARPWLDEESLKGGQDWGLEIEEILEKADLVFFLGSKHSETKKGVIQKELRLAEEWQNRHPDKATYLIPLKIEPCDFPQRFLKKLHWIEMYPDWEEGMQKIQDILHAKQAEFTSM